MGKGVKDDRFLAKEALVFMLAAINDSWKDSAGYFIVDGVSGSQRGYLVKTWL